jgi:hypothetical protein
MAATITAPTEPVKRSAAPVNCTAAPVPVAMPVAVPVAGPVAVPVAGLEPAPKETGMPVVLMMRVGHGVASDTNMLERVTRTSGAGPVGQLVPHAARTVC